MEDGKSMTAATLAKGEEYYNDVIVTPANNIYNSARLEFLKSQKDHFLYDQDELRQCSKCGELYLIHIVYYYHWGKVPGVTSDIIKPNDQGMNNGLLVHMMEHRMEAKK